MEKSYIEKVIKKKAEDRFNTEWNEAVALVADNPILRRVYIETPDTDGGMPEKVYLYESGGENRMILSKTSGRIDFENIKKQMVEIYEKEETEALLNKLDAVKYLFEGM